MIKSWNEKESRIKELEGEVFRNILAVDHIGGDVAMTVANDVVVSDTSGGALIVVLPDPAAAAGRTFVIKAVGANTNPLTIAPNASENINGVASDLTIATDDEITTLISDGTDWITL